MRKYGLIVLLFTVIISDSCFGKDQAVLDVQDSVHTYKQASQKGRLDICLYSPFINRYHLNVDNYGRQTGGGYDGIAGSLDYYYANNKFVSFSLNGLLTYDSPFFFLETSQPMTGVNQFYNSSFWGLTKNHKLGNINIGYGISVVKDYWIWQNMDDGYVIETRERHSRSLGLMFPVSLMLGKSFYLGLIYRPTFIQLTPNRRVNFENLISYCFGMRFSMEKKNNGSEWAPR
jgi:hypothetical protein